MRNAIAVASVLALVLVYVASAQSVASLDLLRRAADPNPGLNSYTADAHLSATLHILAPIHREYDGKVYYLKPKRKIEFTNVTGSFARFKDLVTSTPSYDEAMQQYTIAPQGDDGKSSTYVLAPKNTGSRVKNVTLQVDDSNALIDRATWAYNNGGTLSFAERYEDVGAYHLPGSADIEARFPGYSVDGTITFAAYAPNEPVSPTVFASPKSSPPHYRDRRWVAFALQ